MADKKNLLDFKALRGYFGKARSTLCRWREQGAPFELIGGKLYADPKEIEEWRARTGASVAGPKKGKTKSGSGGVTTQAETVQTQDFMDLEALDSEISSESRGLSGQLQDIEEINRLTMRAIRSIKPSGLAHAKVQGLFFKLQGAYSGNAKKIIDLRDAIKKERQAEGKLIASDKVVEALRRLGAVHERRFDKSLPRDVEVAVIKALADDGIKDGFSSDLLGDRIKEVFDRHRDEIADEFVEITERLG